VARQISVEIPVLLVATAGLGHPKGCKGVRGASGEDVKKKRSWHRCQSVYLSTKLIELSRCRLR